MDTTNINVWQYRVVWLTWNALWALWKTTNNLLFWIDAMVIKMHYGAIHEFHAEMSRWFSMNYALNALSGQYSPQAFINKIKAAEEWMFDI